jgi:phenylacetaldehyde dehydrogenase
VTIVIRKPALRFATAAFLKKHRLLIVGKWVDAESVQTLPVDDPAAEEVIGHVTDGEIAHIDFTVTAERR